MADLTDEDFAFALSLQDELSTGSVHIQNTTTSKSGRKRERSTSIVDECWETIDPTPDIWQMFLQFNQTYFEGKLAGCEVKWSPRMTLCAGVCCYEGRGGLCCIKLSLPLLKLRPRKDLVQTLLHEMIHALLFVTRNNKDHDAHGPEFHKHMYRINQQSGTNITVYHNFHDEVDLYRQHWWRCNGPCQKRPPYYGLVKRAMNRAPSERDPWWADHQQKCGGLYIKIKEPDDYGKKKRKIKDETSESIIGKSVPSASGMVKISDMWRKESSSDSIATKDKENNMQKSNSGSAAVITPFVGKGYALGTSKNGNSTETQSKLVTESLSRNKENSLFKSINRDASIDSKHGSSEKINGSREVNTLKTSTATEELQLKNELFKTPQQKSNGHRKLKKNDKLGSGSELTIIDAFKRVGKAEKVPIVVIDDSPAKQELSMVSCPICQTNVQKNMINSHLDNCLL